MMNTVYLATAIGVYLTGAGIGIARRPATARKVIEELEASPALTICIGAFTFFLGAALIYAHNRWDDFFTGFLSFFGWAGAVEGILLLAVPEVIFGFAKRLAPSDGLARLFGILTLAIGLAILFISLPIILLSNSPV